MKKLNIFCQRGLSMVELLVALAISSFLILGITQVYIDNKRSYVFQQSQAGNLESSRFAALMLDEQLSKAGYRRVPDQSMLDAFPKRTELSTHCEEFPAEAALTNIKTTTGEIGFCMRYQPAVDGELVCDGNATGLAQNTPFRYPAQSETVYVAIKFTPHATDLNKGTLNCVTSDGVAELLEGIADLDIEFGSGFANEKKLKTTTPFKRAENWSATDGPVRVVRYSVLSVSRQNQRDSDSNVYTQWLSRASAASKTRLEAQDKKQIYQAAMGEQAIRNVMP